MGYPLRHGGIQEFKFVSPRSALVRSELEATLIDDAEQASIFFDPGPSILADDRERPVHLDIRFQAAGVKFDMLRGQPNGGPCKWAPIGHDYVFIPA